MANLILNCKYEQLTLLKKLPKSKMEKQLLFVRTADLYAHCNVPFVELTYHKCNKCRTWLTHQLALLVVTVKILLRVSSAIQITLKGLSLQCQKVYKIYSKKQLKLQIEF